MSINMKQFIFLEFILFVGVQVVMCSEKVPTRAEVQSCSGCTLNRLPEIKDFIYKDVPEYENVEFKSISGALPELVLFDDNYEELQRINLIILNREKCNELLVENGFKKKATKSEDIPAVISKEETEDILREKQEL